MPLVIHSEVHKALSPSSNLYYLQSSADQLSPCLGRERLWTLNWCTNGAVNDQLWDDTDAPRHTEENSVAKHVLVYASMAAFETNSKKKRTRKPL